MGLLANVDSSILKMNLEHGFEIKSSSLNEYATLVSILENLPPFRVCQDLLEFSCLNHSEEKIYFISNSFDGEVEINATGRVHGLPQDVTEFDNEFFSRYLKPVIRLMRLFKEGNICMPSKYYYLIDDNVPKPVIYGSTSIPIAQERYTIENSEMPELQSFIQNTKLPFTESFLQLAFEAFELSYHTQNTSLSFVLLMMSLESLFNPGRNVKHNISRNTAALLGKDKEDSDKISQEIQELYAMRCEIVHEGKLRIITKNDLIKLRDYVRKTIKDVFKIGKNKQDLLDMLNSSRFGKRAWITE